jgi:hypothetical protein
LEQLPIRHIGRKFLIVKLDLARGCLARGINGAHMRRMTEHRAIRIYMNSRTTIYNNKNKYIKLKEICIGVHNGSDAWCIQ